MQILWNFHKLETENIEVYFTYKLMTKIVHLRNVYNILMQMINNFWIFSITIIYKHFELLKFLNQLNKLGQK
ncbi:hypothetical protein HYE24_00905 [Mycoplasmopsis bovis]|nr:hypothetical protein [Mycoplasmopsis bovis]QQH23622.1 hypothetical protein HYE24_00905 [Mycoplasmopsis bovis]